MAITPASTPASSNIRSEPTGIADVDMSGNKRARRLRWLRIGLLSIWGPGLVVMLADTDVGSIVTSAQSGAEFGYKMVLPLLVLIPILYAVQEMTVRLGIITGKGHGVLIRDHFGRRWAMLSAGTLFLSSIGALLTEFAGIAGIGELFGISPMMTVPVATAFLIGIAVTGSYRRTERVGIALGLAELAFVPAMLMAHPNLHAIGTALVQFPLHNGDYVKMLAANIGAVIMPWMIFYQQSAVADKGLRPEHYRDARWDTAAGAVVTQLVMAAVLISTAATIGKVNPYASLNTIGDITHSLTPFMGVTMGRLLFSLGVLGAAMIASVVVSLAAAWGFGEVTGYKHSLEHNPLEAPWFYVVFTVGVLAGAVMVAAVPDLVALTIWVEVMNAFLLPMVLGFLVALGMRALPPPYRISGIYRWIVVVVTAVTSGLAIYAGLRGM